MNITAIRRYTSLLIFICLSTWSTTLLAQQKIDGRILDATTGDPLIGANVEIAGTTIGTTTDYDGYFELSGDITFPINLISTYLGYEETTTPLSAATSDLVIKMGESSVTVDVIEVRGSRISEDEKKAPLTIESMDVLAIKETASSNFYEGLGALKNVDITTASLGFQVVNTRGFNSTSPVRSLQLIDGVDNQAPGLNFSLGNFLGSSELDVLGVDLIVGASSAFYGPNAFNGVIKMETKSPFFHKGLAASVKYGERNLLETSVRWAQSFKNKEDKDWFAYKVNLSYMQADDWEADNFDPVTGSRVDADNPGGFDAVNIYGDEYIPSYDNSESQLRDDVAGIGAHYRTGYKEEDLVDYSIDNIKTNAALHFRLQPEKEFESPEIVLSGNYSTGSTVYQGDNRFRLDGIQFFQGRAELRKRDKYFVRAYMTQENAGNSYDPYFTALLLQTRSKSNNDYNVDFVNYWINNIRPEMFEAGYPMATTEIIDEPPFFILNFDDEAAQLWLDDNEGLLEDYHRRAREQANTGTGGNLSFLEPGTPEFEEEFNRIINTPSGDPSGGTLLVDRSALYHAQGEYTFEPTFLKYLKVGASYRLYRPESDGTIFNDGGDENISNSEYGIYAGFEKDLLDKKLNLSATIRTDKNENFQQLFSPAASLVYTPKENNTFRFSMSSAIRNPTLTDQFLDFNVGRAILSGNLTGQDSVITIESFNDFRNDASLDRNKLEYFDIAAIKPERVQTFELGYRTTIKEKTYVDAGYYYSIYNDFIGFNLGLRASFDQTGFPTNVQAFRYSANSVETVTTQGFSIGLNHYFGKYYKIGGNYSWNQLVSAVDDPIVPAFNTPEHKFNVTLSGRSIPVGGEDLGFNINYKWIEGFVFEGSPQFTGDIPTYDLLDVQVNYSLSSINSVIKVGASNILDNQVFQTYGGPRVGRLAYISFVYDFKVK